MSTFMPPSPWPIPNCPPSIIQLSWWQTFFMFLWNTKIRRMPWINQVVLRPYQSPPYTLHFLLPTYVALICKCIHQLGTLFPSMWIGRAITLSLYPRLFQQKVDWFVNKSSRSSTTGGTEARRSSSNISLSPFLAANFFHKRKKKSFLLVKLSIELKPSIRY